MSSRDDILDDESIDVARYVFRSETSGTVSFIKRVSLFYLLLSQCSVILPHTGVLQGLSSKLVPMFVQERLTNVWYANPKSFIFSMMLLLLFLYRSYPVPSQQESLLAMRSIGIQTTSRGTSRFIPTAEVGSSASTKNTGLFLLD